jgi:hypothetical protein
MSVITGAAALVAGQTKACPVGPGDPKVPARVQIINTNAGSIVSAVTHQDKDTVYVEGSVRRPSLGMGAHVHLWGLDKNHRQIFLKTASVAITGNPSFIHSESYIVSVDRCIFRKAHWIYIRFDGERDDGPAD